MKKSVLNFKSRVRYNFLFVLQHFFGSSLDARLTKYRGQLLNDLIKTSKNNEPEGEDIFCGKGGLLRGKASDWDAVKTWSLDFFTENYGKEEVYIVRNKGVIDKGVEEEDEKLSLAEYIEQLKEGSKKYLKLSNLVQNNERLQNSLDLSWLKSLKESFSFGETFYSFIGGKGTKTPLHNEFPTTVYVQVSGRKKWTVYPPKDGVLLNEITERRTYFFSNVVPNEMRDKDNGLVNFARRFEVILEPGDVLIIPPFYWHYVENLSDSIGLAYKYANLSKAFKSSFMHSLLFLMSTRPSIVYSFFATRFYKDDYVLRKQNS